MALRIAFRITFLITLIILDLPEHTTEFANLLELTRRDRLERRDHRLTTFIIKFAPIFLNFYGNRAVCRESCLDSLAARDIFRLKLILLFIHTK